MKILKWQLFLEELVGEKPIVDIQSYIDGMGMSISDKMFFVDRSNFDVIVDFGCANGSFLSKLQKTNPNAKLIGYDLDTTMISKAKTILGKRATLTNNWSEVVSITQKYKSPLLNLSSVIHEVYSYSGSNEIRKFWDDQVFGGDFRFISIRDMIPSVEMEKSEISEFKDDVRKVRRLSDSDILNSFENRWGPINHNYRTFIHYLLKYRYVDNWEREVNENYLPLSLETLKSKIPQNYKIAFEDNFILSFLQQQIKKDFGISISHPTHTKMLIKNLRFRK